jgi:hypothetical protein
LAEYLDHKQEGMLVIMRMSLLGDGAVGVDGEEVLVGAEEAEGGVERRSIR